MNVKFSPHVYCLYSFSHFTFFTIVQINYFDPQSLNLPWIKCCLLSGHEKVSCERESQIFTAVVGFVQRDWGSCYGNPGLQSIQRCGGILIEGSVVCELQENVRRCDWGGRNNIIILYFRSLFLLMLIICSELFEVINNNKLEKGFFEFVVHKIFIGSQSGIVTSLMVCQQSGSVTGHDHITPCEEKTKTICFKCLKFWSLAQTLLWALGPNSQKLTINLR